MNITKLLAMLSDLWSKHAPTVFMHIIMFVIIRLWVLDSGYVFNSQLLWDYVKNSGSEVLGELGFQKVELGYFLAIVILIYLNIVQWISRLISQLRLFAISYTEKINPGLIVFAAEVLRTDPQIFMVQQKSNDLADAYVKSFRNQNKPEPYEWLNNKVNSWERYYGLSIIAFIAASLWVWYDSPGASSSHQVVNLFFCILVIALISRYKARKTWNQYRDNIRYAALYEQFTKQRDQNDQEPHELSGLRSDILRRDVEYYQSYLRHPAVLVWKLLHIILSRFRIPEEIRRKIMDRLPAPTRNRNYDWELVKSKKLKQRDDDYVPPRSLCVDSFKNRFTALLECEGAGLFLLVNQDSGLAPSVKGGGSYYSFKTRKHEGVAPGLFYFSYTDQGETHRKIRVDNYPDQWGYLAIVGEYPIELLAQRTFPSDSREKKWWELTDIYADTSNWKSDMFDDKGTELFGIQASCEQPLLPGVSYIYRTKSKQGFDALIAFQCFLVKGAETVLVAWKILDVHYKNEKVVTLYPWWDPKAWMGLFTGEELYKNNY